MRLALKILLAVVSATVSVLLLEGGARLLNLSTGIFLNPAADNCLQRSPSRVMRFRPNCTTDAWKTTARYNSLGLRGAEVRNDASVRILAAGDSCTWGWQVAEDASYPAVLQGLLDERLARGRYQVINAGVPGDTSYQGLRYLRDEGLPLHPAVVIAGYGFNDPAWLGDIEARVASNARWMPLLQLDDVLLEWSRFYRWVRWQGHTADAKWRPPQVPLDKFASNMTEIIALVRQHGAHMLLLRFAQPGQALTKYRNRLAEIAAEQDVPLLTYDGPRFDLVHPTPEGYRSFAEQIFERLRQEGFVQ